MVVSISSWERNDHAVSFMQLGTFTLKTSPSSPEITVVLDGNRTNCNWPKNPCNTINRQSYFFPHPAQATTKRTKQIFFITVYRLFEASSAVVSTREMTNKENTNAKQILSHNSFSMAAATAAAQFLMHVTVSHRVRNAHHSHIIRESSEWRLIQTVCWLNRINQNGMKENWCCCCCWGQVNCQVSPLMTNAASKLFYQQANSINCINTPSIWVYVVCVLRV